jgi:CubicO group peptidase (beta-lactamase class C family)
MEFEAYFGVSAAQHQTSFNKFSAQGFRMISLSIYGDPRNPLFAAVWVLRDGPPWVGIHGVDATDYQAFFTKWSNAGYSPVLVSATGDGDKAVFASVFEQGSIGALGRHNMTPADFAAAHAAAVSDALMLRSFSVYGTSADRRYAAVWHPNPTYVKSTLFPAVVPVGYQSIFNAATQLPGVTLNAWRPAYVAIGNDETRCAVYQDDWVGAWSATDGLYGKDLGNFYNQQVAQGFYPIMLQGGGFPNTPIYSAVFAKQDIPDGRQWTVTGTSLPVLQPIDRAVQLYMAGNGIRAAQVAIARNGTVIASRAYTWAEPAYRVTQPTDRFLLASCSKLFCEAAVQSLYDIGKLQPPVLTIRANDAKQPVVGDTVTGNKSGATAIVQAVNGNRLTLASVLNTFTTADTAATMSGSGGTVAVLGYDPGTRVYPLLGFSRPADARSDSITVQQLLDHQGGYNDGENPRYPAAADVTYAMRQVGQALGRVVASKHDVASYMYGQPLQFTPGTDSAYSNYGYLLLGAVIEKVTGQAYHDYLVQALLQPAGIGEVEVFPTRAAGRTAQQAIAEDAGLGPDPLDLGSTASIPAVYGGDGEINEIGDPNDGTAASAEAMARFIGSHAVIGNGGRSPGLARSGGTPGASTFAKSRWEDNLDWAYTINTSSFAPTNGPSTATTTVKGSQALTTAPFTLAAASGGTAGFQPTGHLLVDIVNNDPALVAYAGINAAASSFTGCSALGGSAVDGASVRQATVLLNAPALIKGTFTLNVNPKGTQGFTPRGMLLVRNTSGQVQVVSYAAINGDSFVYCNALLDNAGMAAIGSYVQQAPLYLAIDALLDWIRVP